MRPPSDTPRFSYKMLYNILYVSFLSQYIGLFSIFHPPTAWATSSPVLNELMVKPAGSDTDEWIELYSSDPDFSSPDYWIDDDNALVVENAVQTGSDDPGSDPVHLSLDFNGSNFFIVPLSSYLNNTGDHPTLFLYQNETATVVDDYQYLTNPKDDVTFGRWPDGGPWAPVLTAATKGSPNSPPPSPTAAPSPTPTPTPNPTSTPRPANTATPSKEPTPTRVVAPSTSLAISTATKVISKLSPTSSSVLGEKTEVFDEEPTARLEVETVSTQSGSSPSGIQPTEQIATDTSSRPALPLILIIAGGILTLGAGIPLLIQELRSRRPKLQ